MRATLSHCGVMSCFLMLTEFYFTGYVKRINEVKKITSIKKIYNYYGMIEQAGSIYIECESENGFPDVDREEEPIICITVKDHARKSILVFGCGNFVNDRDDVRYIRCSTERDLVQKFTEFWTSYNPDIVTGWNVKFFDIPYLMNRFRYLWVMII